MAENLNWGILGTGHIAHKFAQSVDQSTLGKVVAVGSRSNKTAEAFSKKYKIPSAYPSYQDVLTDEDVQAVYIAIPHPYHAEWAIKAARAGKHILCEKPMGINHAQCMGIIEEAKRHEVFLMEAYMYRCHPLITRLIQILQNRTIGEIKAMRIDFSFSTPFDEDSRLFNKDLAGGGILDVGGYPVSLARLIAGVCLDQPFADPVKVQGIGHLGSSGVDEYAIANLQFANDICAQVSCGVHLNREWDVVVYGSEGSIHIENPWLQFPKDGPAKIHIRDSKNQETVEEIHFSRLIWSYEVDRMAAAVKDPEELWPAMSHADSLGNMKVMDQWREDLGLIYPGEKKPPPLSGQPIQPRRLEALPTARFPGSDKTLSRLVMGVDNQKTVSHAAVMFDDFLERGGNAFDTAWVYGQGLHESVFGKWLKERGVREDIFLIGKGGHTPFNDPVSIVSQLKQSLKRLKTDYLDLYCLHRDNLSIPAGEFIEALNRFKQEGHIRAFGASNWSLDRVDEANQYAEKNGLEGFSAVSNQFSLAEMINPVWPDCISASDTRSRKWFESLQMPLFSWSSQARGFFLKDIPSDSKEMKRCWVNPGNLARRERAQELAKEKDTTPLNIALAYVLNQPFPVFSLFGPRTLEETRTSTPGAYISLTPEELSWLNLES